MRFIIIVEKHKPHNLKNSVRFRRRIASTVFAAVPRLFLIAIRVSICKDAEKKDFSSKKGAEKVEIKSYRINRNLLIITSKLH